MLLSFLVIASLNNTQAQSAEDSVKATVRKMFFAMMEADGECHHANHNNQ